jgi:pyruvate dehydrogenase E2 component (dihydrolipoamide acetyltransferase)
VTDFTLPELGENVESGDVLRILVKTGDTIAKDQPVIELETDKATIEVPSSVAGQVTDIKIKAGDKVKVGQAILSVEDGGAPAQNASAATEPPGSRGSDTAPSTSAAAAVPEEGSLDQHVEGQRASVSADKAGVTSSTNEDKPGDQSPAAPRGQKVVDISRGSRTAAESPAAPEMPPAPASPQVRRLAREVGVDINDVPGSGPGGRISIDDVKAHVSRLVAGPSTATGPQAPPLPDFSRWGTVERQPMRGIRRKTAQHLSLAWSTIPHVTQHDLADVTALDDMRHRYGKEVEAAGGNLTLTAILVKIVAAALSRFPQFNASVDMAAEEIVFKKYVNIGVAVDTGRGLLVPVIRDADVKNVTAIALALTQLSEKARQGKLSLDEMQGGCFSISNLGGIGGTSFTPIVNAPEVAILGVSRARTEPVYRDGQLLPRLMLPLSLSYDHRAIDGADGARFLRWIVVAVEQPFLITLQG